MSYSSSKIAIVSSGLYGLAIIWHCLGMTYDYPIKTYHQTSDEKTLLYISIYINNTPEVIAPNSFIL